ncbi:MAG: hypothetical protein KAG56_08475 [Sulfurovaceae bacterium]|nr:hypothetical protein [Sulfurovaceae bacterium]
MKRLTIKLILGLLLSLLFTLPSLSQSDTKKGLSMIEQNSTIQPFTLNDQFGKEHNINTLPKLLICSFGKETGKLISSYFNAQSSDYLAQYDIKLMADVSSVPSLLRSTFIMPKMKKYSFEILISTDSKFSKLFPREEDKLTVIKLENGVVQEIIFVGNEVGLKETIEG